MISPSFASTKTLLHDLLARADRGKLQLPDLQGAWDWLFQPIEAATGKTINCEPELFRAGVAAEACTERLEEWGTEEPLEAGVS